MASSVGSARRGNAYAYAPNEASALLPGEEEETYPNYLCVRDPCGSCKRITITFAGLVMAIAGTAILVANIYNWKSRAIIYIGGATAGAGIEAVIKFTFPPAAEAVFDEFFLYTAPKVFQVITQWERNEPHSMNWKTGLFGVLSAHLCAITLSQFTNVLSADAVQLNGFSSYSQSDQQPLYGNTKNFVSVLKMQSLFITTSLALVGLGIWQLATTQDTLMFNIASFLVGREVGVLAGQPFLDWKERLQTEFDSSLRSDQAIPPSTVRVLLSAAMKLIPYTLPFIYGGVASLSSNWNGYGYIGIGTLSGVSRITKARHAERGSLDGILNHRSHESWTQLFLDAATPYPRYLFSSAERSQVSSKRIKIDFIKGTLAIATVAGIVAWMAYWFFKFNNLDDRVQTTTAISSAILSSLLASGLMAWCSSGDTKLKRSTLFQLENFQDFLGPIYLAFFDQFIQKQGSISKAVPMWVLWNILFIVPLVIACKKGKGVINTASDIIFMWDGYTADKFIDGQLKG